MPTKQDVVNNIINLMKTNSITLNDLAEQQGQSPDNRKGDERIKHFSAIIGAVFVLSGLGVYISQHWEALNSAARVLVTLGSGIVFFILAIFAHRDVRYEKSVTTLFMLAALFEANGMFVAINEFYQGGENPKYAALVVFGVMLVQQLITFWRLPRTSLLFTSIVFGAAFFGTIFDIIGVNQDYIPVMLGALFIYIATALYKTNHCSIIPFWYFVGSMSFLCGTFNLLQDTNIEIIYLGITMAFVYLSTVLNSKVLLFMGALSMIGYIGYFGQIHFVDTLGWPLSLILFGFIMLAISAFSVKISKRLSK